MLVLGFGVRQWYPSWILRLLMWPWMKAVAIWRSCRSCRTASHLHSLKQDNVEGSRVVIRLLL